jgi:hypothetical protein
MNKYIVMDNTIINLDRIKFIRKYKFTQYNTEGYSVDFFDRGADVLHRLSFNSEDSSNAAFEKIKRLLGTEEI